MEREGGKGWGRTGAEAGTGDDGLRCFGLQADVQLEPVDLAVELFRGGRYRRIGVPLQEAVVP